MALEPLTDLGTLRGLAPALYGVAFWVAGLAIAHRLYEHWAEKGGKE